MVLLRPQKKLLMGKETKDTTLRNQGMEDAKRKATAGITANPVCHYNVFGGFAGIFGEVWWEREIKEGRRWFF